MNLIVDKTIRYKHIKRFWQWHCLCSTLGECNCKGRIFAVAGDLSDGTMRPHCPKLFYSPLPEGQVKKELGLLSQNFKWFDKLYYIDADGQVKQFIL